MTAREALGSVEERLGAAGCESPHVDAEILVAHVLGLTRSELRVGLECVLGADAEARLESLVRRRERREPLAYVLGEWGFRRLTLAVDSRVLVPRPETEVVVERCLALLRDRDAPHVLDVGTGSGAVALSIADEHPGALVTAMDSSADALAVARENVARTSLEVELLEADLFEGLPAGPWDLVVSNPPYVGPDEIDGLESEVRDWEPRVALVGVGATEAIVRASRSSLRSGGAIVLEVADGAATRVAELLAATGLSDVRVTRDLAGRERVVEGVAP